MILKSALRVRAFQGISMTQKYISVLALAIAGAAAAFAQITLNSVPSRSVGSPLLNISSTNPNLVEGRELYSPQSVAVDTSVSPPIIYVSDTDNNRVLAWKNANSFQSGQFADLAIGQPDLLTTFQGGPGTAYSTGLYRPTGIAVYKGDLYVADSGNNRVLRYPNPFNQVTQQQKQFPTPDLWIGQNTVNGRNINYSGSSTPNAQGIYLSNGSTVYESSIAFDSQGDLWMTDPGNLRVLEFKASDVAAGGGGPTATLELGQLDFVSLQTPLSNSATSQLITNQFFSPDALNFDPSGNLFVTDFNSTYSRVMVFTAPFSTGKSASRLMGVFPSGYVYPTDATARQALLDNTVLLSPESVFFLTGSTPAVGVVDSGSSRILLFDVYANWPAGGVPPQAKSIFGQANTCPAQQTSLPAYALCRYPNNGNPRPSASTLGLPGGAFATSTDLFVADSGNNRVLDLPISGNTLSPATRVLGQDRFDTGSINLIEGREFQFLNAVGTTSSLDSAIAIDASSGTPHLYVSDPGNNRVLGFKDLRNLKPGARADIVIGQPDLQTALVNYPANDSTKPNSSGLYRPIGLLVDSQGNLYVADSLNGRVLRFPAPFAYTGSAPEPADLVLGQQNFTTKITDATSSSMLAPYGLAFTPSCNPALPQPCAPNGLLVSDQGDNRVLYIPTTNGTFTAGNDNGKAATIVFGQQSFNGTATGTSTTNMNSPHGISCDTSGFVYLADSGNNRILIFNDPHNPTTPTTGDAASLAITGLNDPLGVFVSPQTGEIWVANSGAGTSVRYANYNSAALGNGVTSTIQEVSSGYLLHPLAVAQDQYGDLYVADDANRVAFYYPGLTPMNGANFLTSRALAPGVVATLKTCTNCSGNQFGTATTSFTNYPMPPVLSDTEVLFNGTPAPLYFVSPGQVNFFVPNYQPDGKTPTPTSGTADVEVVQVSTGQVLGATLVQMQPVSPGVFEYPGGQSGKTHFAAVINQDNTINGPSNPAPRGSVISIYATGQGYVPGAPPDGTQATTVINSQTALTVYLNAVDVNTWPDENFQHIQYSGLDQYPGIWQINVQIPKDVPPSSSTGGSTPLAIMADGVVNYDISQGWYTVIAVK
jgi:uncharacterized protein (TIGR03437 family)